MSESIGYNDDEAIKKALVGRRIVRSEVEAKLGTYAGRVRFHLDDGTSLVAAEADGGCACSNGCFDIKLAEALPGGVITNAEVAEDTHDYMGRIKLFVYTDGSADGALLFTSEGTDNGYYGWGYHLTVEGAAAVTS